MSRSFLELPVSVRNHILKYLPQQSLINLALTNYELYHPCMQQLYARITIQPDPPLRPHHKGRENDFHDSVQTVVYGFAHVSGKLIKPEVHTRMIIAKLKVLIQALSINTELISYVKQVHVLGFGANTEMTECLQELIDILKSGSVEKFYVGDYKLRGLLNFSNLTTLTTLVLDDEDMGEYKGNHVNELLIGSNINMTSLSQYAENLKSLILPNDHDKYWQWVNHNLLRHKIHLPKLERFKIVFSLEEWELNIQLMEVIPWKSIKELELVIGYKDSNDTDYVIDFYNLIPVCPKLTKISIIQGDIFPNHVKNEIFDLNTFNFITNILSTSPHMVYLSIKHQPLALGDFPDGMEGNYFRRRELFMKVLPKIINNHNIVLILPNLFESFAGYEQYMNLVLWNGCKCNHCDLFLDKLDQYLMHHKYYNGKFDSFRDMNASHLFTAIAYQLNQRMIKDELLTQLSHLRFPLTNRLWDFHSNSTPKDFKCFEEQLIDQGEYDEDQDHNPNVHRCEFDESVYIHIPVAISHYLNGLVLEILHLNRGNAEAEDDEKFMDGGDEGFRLNMRKFIVNGVSYILDHEINGTHFYENVYDIV
ncbi:Non-SCF-type F-box protein ROY1 [Spathaspora sp. JA1]|nr:Non-SCF-type F-box protein ROY1 [Spathaspora sp. JA1]